MFDCWEGGEAQAGPDLLAPVATSAAGQASLSLTIPNDFTLASQAFRAQVMVTDPTGTAWGVSLTNGLECVMGF